MTKFFRLFLFLTLSLTAWQLPAQLKENIDYKIIKPQIVPLDPSKIEIVEFFSYACNHCRSFEPILKKYISTVPSDITLRQIHVEWGGFDNLRKIASAVVKSDSSSTINQFIFSALFDDKVNLLDEKEFIKWINTQQFFNNKALLAAYNNPKNIEEADKMKILTEIHKITATPTIIVGGTYQIDMKNIETEDQLFSALTELVEKVRAEKEILKKRADSLDSFGSHLAFEALTK